MKLILLVLGCCFLCWGANELYQRKTRFGLAAKFTSPTFSSSPEWEFAPLNNEEMQKIKDVLSQRFSYFAHGSQAFSFISEDGEYVIKMFKQHKWHPKNLLGYLPLPFNPYFQDYLKRKEKQYAVLESCKTALLYVREDTGVIYAHLNPTSLEIAPLDVVDKHGKAWKLNLNKSCFLLQKRAELFYPHVQRLMEENEVDAAKYAITSTFKLLDRFVRIGVFENNAILRKNFGFINNEAMQFDVEKFNFDVNRTPDKKEIRMATKNFRLWVRRHYPELLSHFDATLDTFSPKT